MSLNKSKNQVLYSLNKSKNIVLWYFYLTKVQLSEEFKRKNQIYKDIGDTMCQIILHTQEYKEIELEIIKEDQIWESNTQQVFEKPKQVWIWYRL